jgi:glutamyl-tRNA synthetase
MSDALFWWQVCAGEVEPKIAPEEASWLARSSELLPQEPFDPTTWKTWTARVASVTGRKGKALFQPLRLALTAREHGPEMQNLLPLIGRDRAVRRLTGETA